MKKGQRKKAKLIIILSSVVVGLGLIAYLSLFFVRKNAVDAVAKDAIWNNIFIEDIDMSGMKKDEALQRLEDALQIYQKEKVTLTAEGKEVELTMGDLGLKAENMDELVEEALSYGKTGSVWARYKKLQKLEDKAQEYDMICQVDLEVAKKVITEQVPNFDNEAVDATIKRENGKFIITDSAVGRMVDVEASLQIVKEQFGKDWKHTGSEIVELVATIAQPKVTREQLEQIDSKLGTNATHYGTGIPRGRNVELATSRINGVVLMPGEEFSTSETILSRTQANGYEVAGAFQDGQVVDSVGGGVCQVASTLYAAALYAELEVTERHPHSMIVGYGEVSGDATIAEGSKDMKFKNSTETPIYIEGYTKGSKIVFNIYGKETRPSNRTVTYKGEVLSEEQPTKKFVATSDAVGVLQQSKAGNPKVKSQLWKIVKENGVQVSKEVVNKSNYRMSASTWSVGTATDNSQAKKLITDAVATQDEAKIRDAIARAQALIKESQQTAAQVKPQEPQTPDTPGEESNE